MNCTSSCKTKDHESYGDCLRANTPMFMGVTPSKNGWDQTKVKKDEKELKDYWAATRQGIEPRSTKLKDIDGAVQLSNEGGKAFDGISMTFKDQGDKMPNVGGKEYPYTAKGMAMAKMAAKKTGKKMIKKQTKKMGKKK